MRASRNAAGASARAGSTHTTPTVRSARSDDQKPFQLIPCAHCGRIFTPRRRWARFCCRECNLAEAGLARKPRDVSNCQHCGGSLAGMRAHAKYCSPACRLVAHKVHKMKKNLKQA